MDAAFWECSPVAKSCVDTETFEFVIVPTDSLLGPASPGLVYMSDSGEIESSECGGGGVFSFQPPLPSKTIRFGSARLVFVTHHLLVIFTIALIQTQLSLFICVYHFIIESPHVATLCPSFRVRSEL